MDYNDLRTNLSIKHSIEPGFNQSGDGTKNGDAVDCQGISNDSVVQAAVLNGAATGSPTSYSIDWKIQESDDGSTGWTDCVQMRETQVTADETPQLLQARRSKRYVRVVAVVAFVNGSTPTIDIGAAVLLKKRSAE
jgi:hypothetical protein